MEPVTTNISVEKENDLIQLMLNDYLQGRPVKDIERLRNAFHPDAFIRTNIDGKLVQWTLSQYLDLVSTATIQECTPELLSYSWDGDTGAAKVQLTFDSFRFIDRFNFIKLDGKWQIIDKLSYRQELS